MKNFILVLAMTLLPVAGFAQSGTTGDLTWSLSGGTLTISGNGPMPDYTSSTPPWYSSEIRISITSVVIDNGVTSIGLNAFENCSILTSVDIPNSVTTIGDGAFYNCSSMTSVDIPNSVTTIGDGAFYNCSSMTSVNIPNSVTTIGEQAFSHCSNLTSVSIPNSVTTIGNSAFSDCSGLKDVYVGWATPLSVQSNTFLSVPASACTLHIPAGTEALYKAADVWKYFKMSSVMQSGTMGDLAWSLYDDGTLTISGTGAIPDYAYPSFAPWYSYRESITSAVIDNGVTSIGVGAFHLCSSLTSVNIPNSVTTIGLAAFENCRSLTSVNIPNSVTTIGNGAFHLCRSLTSVNISNSVTTIGYEAFGNCSKLEDIYVEWTTPLSVPSNTFLSVPASACTLHIPAGTEALYRAADVWKDFNISNVVKSGTTGDLAWSLSNDGTLTISGTGAMPDYIILSYVPWYSSDRGSITSVVIDNGVTSIGNNAFYGCRRMTSVSIPNSVTTIGNDAFYDCGSLTSVDIPNSVTTIGNYVFWNCSNLKDIYVEWATPLSVQSNPFLNVPLSSCTLHVPAGTEALYRAADVWKDFYVTVDDTGNAPVGSPERVFCHAGVLTVHTPADETVAVYSLNGAPVFQVEKTSGQAVFQLHHLPKGIYIVRGSSGWTRKILRD